MSASNTRLMEQYRRVAGKRGNRYVARARSFRTWQQYSSANALFASWCKAHDYAAMPAKPSTLLAYVLYLADKGMTYSTIAAYLAAISTQHRIHGHRIDRFDVAETLRGIRRSCDRPREARPLLGEELRGILAQLDPDNPADARDGAILAIGWAAALRRVEIAGLNWRRHGTAPDRGTGILRVTAAAVHIILSVAKSSQDRTVRIEIPRDTMPTAAEWLENWAKIANLAPGTPAFRAIDRWGHIAKRRMSGGAIASIIRRRFTSAHRDHDAAEEITGHSLRAGYATTAAIAGIPEYRIRARMRHKTPEMVARYVRAAEEAKSNSLAGIGF